MKRTIPQSVFDSKSALRIAKQATKEATEQLENTPRHMLDEGNPNHPIHDGLFGHDRDDFMAKQYR